MADVASLFSTSTTLYDLPVQQYDGMLPEADCFVVLMLRQERYQPETELLTKVGLPASYIKADQPASARTGLKKLNLKQRLQVQFPKASIQAASIEYDEPITTLQQIQRIKDGKRSSAGRRMSFFEMIKDDLVGVRRRAIMDIVVADLLCLGDELGPKLFYPAETVLVTPAWAVLKNDNRFVCASGEWATMSFVAPSTDFDAKPTAESRKEAEKRYLESLKKVETDEEMLQRLSPPSRSCLDTLQDLLAHLECRGGIWTRAGFATLPSILNPEPRDRPEIIVAGLFPRPFVDRCKAYYRNRQPMQADTTEGPKSKFAPLITLPAYSSSLGSTIDGNQSAAQSATNDFLTGWTVRITQSEPYRSGSAWTGGASAGFVMTGAGAGIAC